MNLVDLLALGLAAWRLSDLLGVDRGPWRLFERLREAVGITHDASGGIESVPEREIALWLACGRCRTLALGGIVAVVVLLWPVLTAAVYPVAVAGIALMVDRRA